MMNSLALDTAAKVGGRSAANVMLALLAVAFMLSYFDRMLMIVLANQIRLEFGLSDKELSILTGAAFVIVYGGCGIYAGFLVDRFSRKKIFAWAVGIWSVTTAVCGFAQSFVQLALARAAVGASESALGPVALSSISDMYPLKKRPMATAIFYVGGSIGVLLAFPIGSWLAEIVGWRMTFLLAGPPGLLLALAIIYLSKNPAREGGRAEGSVRPDSKASMALVRGNRSLLWLLAAYAFSSFPSVGMMQWLPHFFMRSHELTSAQIGLFFGPVLGGGMITGMLLGGWLGNHVAARSVSSMTRMCAWLMLLLIPLYAAVFLVPSLPIALLLTFIAMAASVAYAPMAVASWQTVCDPRARGTATGFGAFVSALVGGALLPFVIGVMSDAWAGSMGAGSLRYALLVSMLFLAITGALYLYSAMLVKRLVEDNVKEATK
jgi:predicted MFS family arabinose efflux permease